MCMSQMSDFSSSLGSGLSRVGARRALSRDFDSLFKLLSP